MALSSQFSYTWGHNLDEVTQYRGQLPQDSTNFKGDYGNSDFDTRNGFVGYANYEIPGFQRTEASYQRMGVKWGDHPEGWSAYESLHWY